MHFVLTPVAAKLVGRHGHRRKRRGRLGLIEAEAFVQLPGYQPAQRDVIDEHEKLYVVTGIDRRGAHLDVIDDDGDLGLEIEPPLAAPHDDVIGGPQHDVGSALINQRFTPEARGHVGTPRATDQLHVIDVGTAVRPLVSARQRRRATCGDEWKRGFQGTVVESFVDGGKLFSNRTPSVEGALQRGSDFPHANRPAQIPRDDEELTIPILPSRCKLHDGPSMAPRRI
jgi:hypothetical protein